LKTAAEKINENCIECGNCKDVCQVLSEVDETPAQIARRGVTAEEAFSCSLCGSCETVCPLSLSPKSMFAEKRKQAVESGEFDIDQYRYLFPDRERNIMSCYREYYGIDYGSREGSGTAFFPGCTLLTYGEGLTKEVFHQLQESENCRSMIMDCCGKPLKQMGLQQRRDKLAGQLREKMSSNKINRLIVGCSGCYYELKDIFKSTDVNIQTIYEVLDYKYNEKNKARLCTVHDSCPDRYTGLFAGQVREALEKSGFPLVEMSCNKENTFCCGSGGQLIHFRPDLADDLVLRRLEEAEKTGADVLVAYCLSCVLSFARMPYNFSVRHALSLLLGRDDDFTDINERSARVLSGPEGQEIWAKIMSD